MSGITPGAPDAAHTPADDEQLPRRAGFLARMRKPRQPLADRIGRDPLGGENLLSTADVDQLHDDLAEEQQVIDLVDVIRVMLVRRTLPC